MINATYFLFLGLTSYVIYRVTNSVWQSVLGAFLVLIMNGLINGVIRGLWARRRGEIPKSISPNVADLGGNSWANNSFKVNPECCTWIYWNTSREWASSFLDFFWCSQAQKVITNSKSHLTQNQWAKPNRTISLRNESLVWWGWGR